MSDFFKTIGQGLIYLVLSPFILLGVALYGVYAFFLFFFMFIKRIVLFFKGEDMNPEMRIDVAARLHLNNQDEELEKKELENSTINVPATNIVKEEKTTIVQPIIIQTDEEGRLKNVSYVTPQGNIPGNITQESPRIQGESDSIRIEARKEDE